MEKIYITIEETMGTDGNFSSEVYLSKTEEDAIKVAESHIADMAITMDVEDKMDATKDREIIGDGWWYRVRIESQGFYQL
jgi:hypothetical protein